MTPRRQIRDFPASVRQRLQNLAREQELDFQRVLDRYTGERFLYRLSASDEVDRFVLKGAALFRIWFAEEQRPTRDLDFLSTGPENQAAIRAALEAICRVPCPEDGVIFDPAAIRLADIRGVEPPGAQRARIRGSLGRIRLHLQVDIGFGDLITPGREERHYPTLLDLPAFRLWAYPRETMVAEKFEAMVSLGETNSREKDLWDIACLARRFAFDGETLRSAIERTFRRGQAALGNERPLALLPGHYEDTNRTRRWRDLRREIGADAVGPDRLVEAGEELRRFLGPVCDSLIEGTPFTQAWPAGGPWRAGIQARTRGEGDA